MQINIGQRWCPKTKPCSGRHGLIAVMLGSAAWLYLPPGDATAAGDAKSTTLKITASAAKSAAKAVAHPDLRKSGLIAEQYCKSVRDAANEARFAFQVNELKVLEKALDERIAQLELRAAELKDWFARREEFAKQAAAQVVNIYAAMRPEAASEQLGRMDEVSAASILSKLDPRAASAILNDIPPEKAARLATILSGASRKNDRGDKS